MADSASFNGVAGVDARSLQRVALQISVVMAPPLHFTPKLPFELGQRREDAEHEAQHEQHAAALEQQATAWQARQQQLSTQVGILTKQYAHITADYKTLAALLAQV